jgi:2Fe-2S ferredoxin
MPQIIVINQSGEASNVEASEGRTLMEIIRDNGFDELLALCGGCCSCATCHVHIDREYIGKLAPMSEDENDLLDSSEHRNAYSRLSCQVPITGVLDGCKVTIAQAD